MAFQIRSENKLFKMIVKVEQITAEGKKKREDFEATCRMLSVKELEDMQRGFDEGELKDRDFIDKVLVGWSGIKDENGNELPFNEENKDIVLQIVPVQACIVNTYYSTLPTAKLKN